MIRFGLILLGFALASIAYGIIDWCRAQWSACQSRIAAILTRVL